MAHYLLIKYPSIDLNKIKDDNKVRCRKERVCTNPASLREGGGLRKWWKEHAGLNLSTLFTSINLSNPL